MLAVLAWTTGPGQDMLTVLRRQFLWYLSGDMMLAVVVAVVHYRLLWPQLLVQLPRLPARWRAAVPLMLGGALAALFPLGLAVLTGLALGAYSISSPGYTPYQPFIKGTLAPAGWKLWVFFGVQSTFEELLFRGIGVALLALLLAWLTQNFVLSPLPPGSAAAAHQPAYLWLAAGLVSNLIVSVAFGFIHRDNPHVTVFAVCNIALAGFALGQLYWLQRSLWGACAMHTVWNASLATFGLPVSGILARGPLLGNIRGSVDNLITGGDFGPEASVVTTAGLVLLSAFLVWRTRLAAQRAVAAAADRTRDLSPADAAADLPGRALD